MQDLAVKAQQNLDALKKTHKDKEKRWSESEEKLRRDYHSARFQQDTAAQVAADACEKAEDLEKELEFTISSTNAQLEAAENTQSQLEEQLAEARGALREEQLRGKATERRHVTDLNNAAEQLQKEQAAEVVALNARIRESERKTAETQQLCELRLQENDQQRDEHIRNANATLANALQIHDKEITQMDDEMKRVQSLLKEQLDMDRSTKDDMERGDQEARERVHHLEHQLGQYQRECEELRQQNSSMRTELEQEMTQTLEESKSAMKAEHDELFGETCTRFSAEIDFLKSHLTGDGMIDYKDRERLASELEAAKVRETKMRNTHKIEIENMRAQMHESYAVDNPRINILDENRFANSQPRNNNWNERSAGGVANKISNKIDLNTRQTTPRFARDKGGLVSVNFNVGGN